MRTTTPTSFLRRAFSIVEVLFAVMILGIGFILVAAMFPVAIQQTQATVDETRCRFVAQNGVAAVTMAFRNLPAVDKTAENQIGNYARGFAATPATFLQLYRSMQIDPDDSRYAFAVLYRYNDAAAPPKTLDLFPVGLVSTINAGFVPADTPNLVAQSVPVVTSSVPGSPPRIRFTNAIGQAIAVEGALVFDPVLGRPYRLGNQVDGTTDTWELVGNAVPASGLVLIIGRYYDIGSGVASGPNQVRYAPDAPITVGIN